MAEIAGIEGRRVYIRTKYGEPAVQRLKDAFGSTLHWEGEKRLWWLTADKREQAEKIIAEAAASPPEDVKEDPAKVRLVGKARYKGRTYYARFWGETKKGYSARLTTLDGTLDFWCPAAREGGSEADGSGDVAVLLKRYEPREYRGQTQYTTLHSIQRFIERQKNPETAVGECSECGHFGPVGTSCRECGGEGTHCG